MLLLLELADAVSKGAVVAKLAFAEMYHIFTHFSFLLFFHILVELVSLLVVGEGLLVLFACCLTEALIELLATAGIFLLIRAIVLMGAVVGGAGVQRVHLWRLEGHSSWHEWVELFVVTLLGLLVIRTGLLWLHLHHLLGLVLSFFALPSAAERVCLLQTSAIANCI